MIKTGNLLDALVSQSMSLVKDVYRLVGRDVF